MADVLVLSQIIVGVRDLDAAADRFRALGFDVLDGGVHPGVGTANRVIPLGVQYIELLGVIEPDLASQNDYGRSLVRATADGDRLVRWSLRTDDIEAVAERLGIGVEKRQRARPADRARRCMACFERGRQPRVRDAGGGDAVEPLRAN